MIMSTVGMWVAILMAMQVMIEVLWLAALWLTDEGIVAEFLRVVVQRGLVARSS